MARLAGKVALITGAGSAGPGWGNGKATAVLFAREGASVFAVDRNRAAAEETAGIIAGEGGVAVAHQADVSDHAQVKAMVEACLARFGRIDVLHNNVGIAVVGGAVELSEEDWDRVERVNQKSVFLVCKHVIPIMERQGGGAIVNTSSIAGIRWLGIDYLSYAATKGAMNMMTKAIALAHARKGIRCNAILPGLMDTPMIRHGLPDAYAGGDVDKMIAVRHAQCPMGRMGDGWDVAHAALFLASDESKYVTGHELVVDGGLSVKCA